MYTHPASGSTPSGIQTQPEAAPRQAYTPRQWQYPVRHTHVGGNYIMPCRSILALNAAIDSFAPLTTSLLGPLVQHLSTILSVCLSVDRSVSLSVCLPTYMFVYLQTSYLFSYYLLLIVKFPSTWTDDQTKETSGQCAGRSAVITVSPARVRRRRGRRRAQTTTDHKQAGRGAAKS